MSSSRRPIATDSTARSLELPALLAMVAALTATDAGRRRVLELAPTATPERLQRRRRAHEEARVLIEAGGPLVPHLEEPLLPCLEALATGDSSFGGEELRLLATLLRAIRDAAARVREAEEAPLLLEAVEALADLTPLRRRIERVLDRRGRVRGDVSPLLTRLGSAARRVRESLYRELKEFSERHQAELSEETIPLHGGRLVLKLRAGAPTRSRGLVHGRSGTGKSVYFEPLEVLEDNNRLQETHEKVAAEKRRLLLELVEEAKERREELEGHLELLGRLDRLQAAVRFAERARGRLAEIAEPGSLELLDARHPLLDPELAALRRAALGQEGHTGAIVPLTLRLEADRRVLVVTGPNAGGKTVALKTIGLLALASQCGLPVPAARGTRLPVCERVVATVGDDQDLLADRSTFSGRLLRLQEAWEAASPAALVLLDELGSGTDPEEGAALAVALVEGLAERRCLAVVTTHLSQLAAAALEREGALCAAMEFDPATGSPTYRLTPGAPGGSEALALARRLGLPRPWLERAEELLGPEQRDLRRLLAEVEQVRAELARDSERVRREGEALARERAELAEQLEATQQERRTLARRLRAELDAFRRQVTARLDDESDRLRAELEAGRRKGLAAAAAGRLFRDAPEIEVEEEERPAPRVGELVEHRRLGWRGTLERLERSRAEVRVGGKRLRCPVEELAGVAEAAAGTARPSPAPAAGDGPAVAAELLLVGKRVEPALAELERYLDRALRADHAEVRVVHGHGTGRLRRAVRDYLRSHPAVATVRPGRDGEGGDGATVVAFDG